MDIREVGVVGLGTMGAGIAEVFARAGLAVTAVEADEGALARGLTVLDGSLDRAVARGGSTPVSAPRSGTGCDLLPRWPACPVQTW